MAVKIRLTRVGRKKQPSYRVVVMDSRKPRDGAYIEQIGRYDPREDPSLIEIDNDRALDWLHKGAQPTERAKKLLEISGAWTRFRVAKGDIHTVDTTPVVEAAPEPAPVMLDDLQAEAAVETAPEPVMLDDLQAEAAQEPVVLEDLQAETAAAAGEEEAPDTAEETT
jgi:small subunit ribosomal protein S16